MYKLFFYLFIVLTLFSCDNRRNPNLPKRQLKELFAGDQAKLSERKNASATSAPTMPEGYVPQAGVKYRQERDLSVTPARIDVVKGVDNVRNITLSQIAKDIEYINLGKHRFGSDELHVQVTPHGLLVDNPDGVWLYNFDGQLIKEIYKNHLSLDEEKGHVFISVGTSMGTITYTKESGVKQVRYNERDDRIWVRFREDDFKNYYGFLGYIDMKSQLNQLNVSDNELTPNPVIPLAEFKKGDLWYADDFVTFLPWNVFRMDQTMITHTFQGDILCRFTFGRDSITALVTQEREGGDGGARYYYHNTQTFRPPYNDTIFRLTAANVVKPVYVLDVGTSGRATNQGKPSDVNLNLMYRAYWHEDDHYLYLRVYLGYTKNHPKQEWWGLYDKKTREFFTFPVVGEGMFGGNTKGIKNDIDGGLPFWPREVGSRGEKYMYVVGEDMKKRISENPSEKLKQFMQSVEDDDLVIVVVK